MTEIAKASGIKRETLNEDLRPNTKPRLGTIQRVFKALGVKLTAAAVPKKNPEAHRADSLPGFPRKSSA